jgi:hypothetical protein
MQTLETGPSYVIIQENASPFARVAAKIIDNGFSAVPCRPKHKVPGEFKRGEWRHMFDWQRYADRKPTDLELGIWSRWPDAGVCVVLGGRDGDEDHVVVVDVDSTDERVIEAIRILPESPVERTGQKGYAAFFRASPSLASATFDVDNKRAVDYLAKGRQVVVPPSLHPSTNRPYVYTSMKTLEDIEPSDLPRLPDDFVERMRSALAKFGEVTHTVDRRRHDDCDDDDTFAETNRAALDNFDAWLPLLGVEAERERDGSYRGPAVWRGGDNPTSVSYDHRGIRDFKAAKGHSPIGLTMLVRGEGLMDSDNWLRRAIGLPVIEPVKFTFRKAEALAPVETEADTPDVAKIGNLTIWRQGARKVKPRQWLIDGLLGKPELLSMYGLPGAGKSNITASLFDAIAHLTEWNGRPVVNGPVVYFAGERAEEMDRRFEGLRHVRGQDWSNVFMIGGGLDIRKKADTDGFIQAVKWAGERAGGPVVAWGTDTYASALGGGDDSEPKAGAEAGANIIRIIQETSSTGVIVQHTGNSLEAQDRALGPQNVRGKLDVAMKVEQDDRGEVKLIIQKDNLQPGGKWLRATFGLESYEFEVGGEGFNTPRLTARRVWTKDEDAAKPEESTPDVAFKFTPKEPTPRALELLAEMRQSRHHFVDNSGPRGPAKVLTKGMQGKAKGIRETQIEGDIEMLFDAGMLKRDEQWSGNGNMTPYIRIIPDGGWPEDKPVNPDRQTPWQRRNA